MTEQPNPNELLLITREELERCCSQMSAAGYKVSANYVEASVLSRSRPAPTAFVPMASNELRDLCAKEWQNRAERKQLAYDHRSWVSGWYDGYFCKPDIREHDATIRNEVTIDDFCICDLTRYIQESSMSSDDVSRCRGKECNYCGKFNESLRREVQE